MQGIPKDIRTEILSTFMAKPEKLFSKLFPITCNKHPCDVTPKKHFVMYHKINSVKTTRR